MSDILNKILAVKREEVAAARAAVSDTAVRELAAAQAPARDFVRREWAGLMEADPRPPMSAKSRLQEWTLGRGLGLPEYRMASSSGPPHQP